MIDLRKNTICYIHQYLFLQNTTEQTRNFVPKSNFNSVIRKLKMKCVLSFNKVYLGKLTLQEP